LYNGALQPQTKVYISKVDVRVQIVGSQSNALAAGDFFNFTRIAFWISGKPYQTGSQGPLLDTHQHVNYPIIERLLADKTYSIHSAAFDSSDYNVPGTLTEQFTIPVNQVYDCYGDTSTSATWGTRDRDLNVQLISDSAVTPHPSITLSMRVWYKLIR